MPPQANPSDPVKDKDKRINMFIAFAAELQEALTASQNPGDIQYLTDDLENQIRSIKSCTLRDGQRYEPLDSIGTSLWNLCTRLKREEYDDSTSSIRKVLINTRVFAFLILALAQLGRNVPKDLIRLTKLAIKTGRSCIEEGELEFALLALQKAADCNGQLQNMREHLAEHDVTICRRLEAEYFILRTALSWKEDRLDIAEHMYGKTESLRQQLDSSSAENLADTLFEIGRGLLDKNDFAMAAKWLERAYEFLNSQELEQLSRETIELRLAISQSLIHALLGLDTTEGFQKAESHVGYVESEIGDKFVVLLLRLEILLKSSDEVFDSNAYAGVLHRMIRNLDLSDSNFKLVIHHIRKLDDKSPSLACHVLDEFLSAKVIPSQRDEWIERVAILRTYTSTNHRDTPETVDCLKSIFDRILAGIEKPLEAATAFAILTLIWKKIDSNLSQGNLNMCEAWSHLALHSLLVQRGPVNTARLSRKLLLCALQKNDTESAMQVFRSMAEHTKSQPMTMYLAYKLALRNGDRQLTSQCIEQIGASSSKDPQFLYACCLDAQESGDKLCALEALKQLAERHEFSKPGPVHFPALLRVTIRLQVTILDDGSLPESEQGIAVDDLCETFEGVVTLLQRDQREQDGSRLLSLAELNWFCKNAYNLGLKHTESWGLRHIIRLFHTCTSIIQFYPKDLPVQEIVDLSLRGMFCHFMIATAYTALTRSEDNTEVQLQDYLTMRKHVRGFEVELDARLPNLDKECKTDLESKLGVLLVFDFEAAVSLKKWDELSMLARKASTYHDLTTLQAMADCMLRAQSSPTQVFYSTLRTIIDEIWKLEKFDVDKLAKYLRCLFRATISSDTEISLRVLEETCRIVKEAAKTEQPFPPMELEWFATTTFNHAVDLYQCQEDELSKKWISHAFTLAHCHRDGGVLEKQLHDHHTHLKWG